MGHWIVENIWSVSILLYVLVLICWSLAARGTNITTSGSGLSETERIALTLHFEEANRDKSWRLSD